MRDECFALRCLIADHDDRGKREAHSYLTPHSSFLPHFTVIFGTLSRNPDGYISKPSTFARMIATLSRW